MKYILEKVTKDTNQIVFNNISMPLLLLLLTFIITNPLCVDTVFLTFDKHWMDFCANWVKENSKRSGQMEQLLVGFVSKIVFIS